MSAVMSTLSIISGGRRAHRKLASSRKSGQLSDAGEQRTRSTELHKQRSASLQTLETSGTGVVNLESLEAKMASIEVSLAGRRRNAGGGRDAGRELDALRNALSDKDTLIQSLKKQLSASLSAGRLAAQSSSPAPPRGTREETTMLSAEERRALEERAAVVTADLDNRRANIQELRRRLEKTHVTDNIDTRIQQAELQYQLGREELELLSLGEQARALAQLIEHADAAARRSDGATLYSTIRECGGSATVVSAEAREGSWGAAVRANGPAIDWAQDNALRPGDRLIEVNGTSVVSCRSPEELQRAVAAARPARLVALRAPTPALTQNEASSLRSELGALRTAADAAERAKEGLRADNTRLTHRISYLEEQVAELLARHTQLHPVSSNDSSCITVNKSKKNVTNINITSEPPTSRGSPKSEVQVFQKGPDITAIVAKLPGLGALGSAGELPLRRPRSTASPASSRAAPSPSPPTPQPLPHPHSRPHSSHAAEPRITRMRHSLSHHCIHAGDYGAETDAAIRMIERNQRHMEKQRLKSERLSRSREDALRSDSDAEGGDALSHSDPRHGEIRKAADRIEESIKKTNWAERKTLSIIEQLKRSQRLRKLKKNDSAEDVQLESEKSYMYHRIDGKVLENAHKSSRRSSKLHSRSAKSSELESECSDFPNGEVYGSSPRIDGGGLYRRQDEEARPRPTPPRKPLRLSLHKARSAHSLLSGAESEPAQESPGKRPVKRTHGGREHSKDNREAREGRETRDGRESVTGARGTPRPGRRAGGGALSARAPPADALYPDPSHAPRWC